MAKELGYFAERGLDVERREAGVVAGHPRQPAQRPDRRRATACSRMPLSVATGIGGDGARDLKVAMMLNNNGQAITLANGLRRRPATATSTAAERGPRRASAPTLAMTFPGGTHDLWLRYWLQGRRRRRSTSVEDHPDPAAADGAEHEGRQRWTATASASRGTRSPSQQGIGFTHLATQDIWQHHPEKALVVTEQFADRAARRR